MSMDILTPVAQRYIDIFSGYLDQFLNWGQWLFLSLLTINLVWMCVWFAFDKESIKDSLPVFIKRFFVVSFFYTLMVNPSWFYSLVETSKAMGSTVTHVPLDPSSLIAQGIGISNKLIAPMHSAGLLQNPLAVILGAVLFILVNYIFIRIALDLALTLIITSALITVASFFLGFAGLGATSQIARQSLDVILGNCMKMLGVYVVVGASSQVITLINAQIPSTMDSYAPYICILAALGLFHGLVKTFPEQLARIVSGSMVENHGIDPAAAAMSAISYAQMAMPTMKLAGQAMGNAVGNLAKIAGSGIANTAAHFGKAATAGGSFASNVGSALKNTGKDMGSAVKSTLSDHFQNMTEKMSGGQGSTKPVAGVAERMFTATQDIKASPTAATSQTPPPSTQRSSTSKPPSGASPTSETVNKSRPTQ